MCFIGLGLRDSLERILPEMQKVKTFTRAAFFMAQKFTLKCVIRDKFNTKRIKTSFMLKNASKLQIIINELIRDGKR